MQVLLVRMNVLSKSETKSIQKIISKKSKESEIEFSILKRDNVKKTNIGLSFINFKNVINYVNNDAKNIVYQKQILDFFCFDKSKKLYRISVNKIENINEFIAEINKNSSNDEVFKILLQKYKNTNFEFIKKEKKDVIDLEEYSVRFRHSEEVPVKLNELESVNIINSGFRFKDRIRYKLHSDATCNIYLDLSIIRINNYISNITQKPRIYEVEIEVEVKKNSAKIISTIDKSLKTIIQLVNFNRELVSISEIDDVLKNYYKLLNINIEKHNKLFYSMPLKSLTAEDCVSGLSNYNVTDKADGERILIYIHNSKIYGITKSINVLRFNINCDSKKLSKYNDTLIDGEYLFNFENKKHVLLAFDILSISSKLVMESLLLDRLKILYFIETDLFKIKSNRNETEQKTVKSAVAQYNKQIISYVETMNKLLVSNSDTIFKVKYFLNTFGINNLEIYNYIKLINDIYANTKIKYPYMLDGVILNSVIDKYTNKPAEIKNLNIKWKPENLNTIDFYLQTKKNRFTKDDVIAFDNTFSSTYSYKVGYLNVGNKSKHSNKEEPVLFKKHENKYIINLIVDENNNIRDKEGNLVLDNTVVECTYDFSNDVDELFKWTILRTRYDKTDNVEKYGINYGNYINVADEIWKSMENPVTKNHIEGLANEDSYNTTISNLSKSMKFVNNDKKKTNLSYYQKITEEGKSLRSFHNWIKSVLINNYCSNQVSIMCEDNKDFLKNTKTKGKTVLDVGCGRGGDLLKFINSNVDFVVNIDKNSSGLDSLNGAKDRYNKFKKKFKTTPDMTFINADFGTQFDLNFQKKKLSNMSHDNEKLFKKYLNKYKTQFDVLNFQFVFHYLLNNTEEIDIVCNNINKLLKLGGHILITAFDGNIVKDTLDDNNGTYTEYFTDSSGNNTKLFEIKYNKNKDNECSTKIDFYSLLLFNDGHYETECLIYKDELEKLLLEKCNLHLIETDLFLNTYNKNFNMINKQYEMEGKNNSNLKSIIDLKNDSNVNKACYEFNKLYRYYVFQKK